ncbi:MAG: signal peptide peptidase SppA [Bacteroides sp.]|nr:signal peptide peptidase SppA [Bacteroides sp.]
MKDFLKIVLGTVVGLILFGIVTTIIFMVGLIGIVASSDSYVEVKDNTVVVLDLKGEISERRNESGNPADVLMEALYGAKEGYGLNEIVSAIKKAKNNDKVKGIYLKPEGLSCGIATVQEIREALVDFKKSGKFIVAYSDAYTQGEYYLSSVADKVMLNPLGSITWKGLSASPMFYKGTLDKIGVEMQIFKVGTYKSAVEPFMQTKMSDANREQVSVFLNSIWNEVTTAVSQSRNINVDSLNMLADNMVGMGLAQNSIYSRLADTLIYKSDVEDYLAEKVGVKKEDMRYLKVSDMRKVKNKTVKDKSGNIVAVYYAVGGITDSNSGMMSGEEIVGGKVVKDLNKLRDDKDIKAVVLRVNSPGGSAFASEQIWNAVRQLKEKKPVIVSMGDYAASGGYYISCLADTIVAQPTTLTGSIGIFGMLPNFKGLTDKVGLTFDVVKTNEHADFATNSSKPLTESEKKFIQERINEGYELFLKRCYEGRGMTKEELAKIAEGRVWTGQTAKELGLVDELGGIERAIEIASQKAGIESYTVMSYPKQEDWFDSLFNKNIGSAKAKLLKAEMGDMYKHYEHIKELLDRVEIQARMPFEYNIK